MNPTTAAALVPLLPAGGAALIPLVARRAPGFVRPLAVLPILASALLALWIAADLPSGATVTAATPLAPTGDPVLPIELALRLDGFSVLAAVLVTAVSLVVQLYSTGYLREDPRYPSYAALISLFTAAMLLLVYADDLVVLLVGWEVMGACSYFLIGHHWETPAARAASLKAFLVTKLGDVPFLIGIIALATEAGTFRISWLVNRLTGLDPFQMAHPTVIALLLLAGVAGKSAQFPLHLWLPDAMAGPTPVSALIHAATMVAAGVYVLVVLLPVLLASTIALVTLALIVAVTVIGSGLAALARDDIKGVLAWSTIGQLGVMLGAIAVADREAAFFHLLTHGAFKALLFLAAGVLVIAAGTGSLAAVSRMGGLKRSVPDAWWTMTIGLLALAALPPFAGFFSKDAVVHAAQRATGEAGAAGVAAWIVLVAVLAGAVLTAAYATRLWLVLFHDPVGVRPVTVPAAPAVGPAMTLALWLLAIPSLALGLAWDALGTRLGGGDLGPHLTTSVVSVGAALLGVLVTWAAWRRRYEEDFGGGTDPRDPIADPGPALLGRLRRPAATGFGMDAAAAALAVRPVRAAGRLARFLDREVVDTYVRAAAGAPGLLGALARRLQTGNVQLYLAVTAVAALALAVVAVTTTGG
ncbi:NADH-quinone oxidoreductase subunit L [Streptomyces sp. ST2-7A]|uniref:NADH-quinone oxidoreductase subunit 5 family protein n=1 Tax=Streptomyces sp. ST2-7A TaxID=2907214 RepID=UPI001F4292BD|nr:NADH-quinone oxidoreductase subunit L [Streptomyces sp. ST2-7A]MCE7078864.1 NADH-quinone oxidoreductase subunit L [Streptomyces sp. ST2-7A]